MWNNAFWSGAGLVGLALLAATPARAQAPVAAPADSALVYEREVFRYARSGRADPFRSLTNDAALAMRFEELTLVGVVYHPDPSRSVIALQQQGAERRLQARVGDRLGSIRIMAIHPRRVDVLIEEFGVARRETLELKPAHEKGGNR